jgi:hypothetical protein
VEERQQEVHPTKEKQLEEPVQEVVVKYLHRTPGHSSSPFKMAGHDPTIRLPEFKGEASEDPEKHLFICEKIWEAKRSQMRIQNLHS